MKFTNQIISFVLFLCLPAFLSAQDVDEIIAKHIKAHGGEKNWEKIETMKFTGLFTGFSEEKPFMSIKTKSGAFYMDKYLGHLHVIESFNGESGWTIDPWLDMTYPRRANQPEVNMYYQKAQFFTPFYKYKEKGHKVEYLGLKDVEGSEMHAIKLTRTNDYEETWYLDPSTYLEYKCEANWVDFARRHPSEIFFDDFREINGVIIPYYTEWIFGQRNRMLVIEDVEINGKIDMSLFDFPKNEDMAKIDFLVGEWDVAVNRMSRRGSWLEWQKTSSTIVFKTNKLIEESIDYEISYPDLRISGFSFDQEAQIYRLSTFHNLNSEIEIHEGNFEESDFVLMNVHIGEQEEGALHSQIKITEITEDGFTIIKSLSRDKERWFEQEKLVYTKKK